MVGGCPKKFNLKSRLGQRYDPTSPYIGLAIFPWQTELVLGLQGVFCFLQWDVCEVTLDT